MLSTCEPRVFHMGTHVFHIKAHILPFFSLNVILSHEIYMYTTKSHMKYTARLACGYM